LKEYYEIAELWKEVETSSCYHTQKPLLDAPTLIVVGAEQHLLLF